MKISRTNSSSIKTLLTILLFVGLNNYSFGSCVGDNRTLTERLFQGEKGTIFTCKILTFLKPTFPNDTLAYPSNTQVSSSNNSIEGTATAEIVRLYFGKVDTNIVTLRTESYLIVGKIYLIYTSGNGRVFAFGGNCDRWSKQVIENSATTNELLILERFSSIFKNKSSGQFIFMNSKNVVLCEGQFKKGKPIKIWKHYYDNGTIKAEFDLSNNSTSQYFTNGFIKTKWVINKNTTIYEQYSDKVNGRFITTGIEMKNDTGLVMTVSEYFENGNKKSISSQLNIDAKGGGMTTTGKTGEYNEFHENGNLKIKGQYMTNKRIGLWKWYYENGEFNAEFDYKDGTYGQ